MIFTQFNTTAAKNSYPMRCVQNESYGYIFNAWADGETLYKNESKSGLTYKAMVAASDDEIAARVRFFDYRCREEFYDFSKDPDALHNMIDDEKYQDVINIYRKHLREYMETTQDYVLETYDKCVK
jgi:N-sulfoglucosamine sulfohydrolase